MNLWNSLPQKTVVAKLLNIFKEVDKSGRRKRHWGIWGENMNMISRYKSYQMAEQIQAIINTLLSY